MQTGVGASWHFLLGRWTPWHYPSSATTKRRLDTLPASSRTCRSRTRCSSSICTPTDRGSPKFERAAMRWLERYLTEGSPRLQHFAEVARDLAKLEVD